MFKFKKQILILLLAGFGLSGINSSLKARIDALTFTKIAGIVCSTTALCLVSYKLSEFLKKMAASADVVCHEMQETREEFQKTNAAARAALGDPLKPAPNTVVKLLGSTDSLINSSKAFVRSTHLLCFGNCGLKSLVAPASSVVAPTLPAEAAAAATAPSALAGRVVSISQRRDSVMADSSRPIGQIIPEILERFSNLLRHVDALVGSHPNPLVDVPATAAASAGRDDNFVTLAQILSELRRTLVTLNGSATIHTVPSPSNSSLPRPVVNAGILGEIRSALDDVKRCIIPGATVMMQQVTARAVGPVGAPDLTDRANLTKLVDLVERSDRAYRLCCERIGRVNHDGLSVPSDEVELQVISTAPAAPSRFEPSVHPGVSRRTGFSFNRGISTGFAPLASPTVVSVASSRPSLPNGAPLPPVPPRVSSEMSQSNPAWSKDKAFNL